jgi:hypothetical protein
MFLLNQPISGRYFKIFVEILCSKKSGVHGAVRTFYRFRLHGHDKIKVNNLTSCTILKNRLSGLFHKE